IIRQELARYDRPLAGPPTVVAANKADLPAAAGHLTGLEPAAAAAGPGILVISAAAAQGITQPVGLVRRLPEQALIAPLEVAPPVRVYRAPRRPLLEVRRDPDGGFRVGGAGVERWVAMTDFDNEEAVQYLQRRLERAGVEEALRAAGARSGDLVRIGEGEFELHDPTPQDGGRWHETTGRAGRHLRPDPFRAPAGRRRGSRSPEPRPGPVHSLWAAAAPAGGPDHAGRAPLPDDRPGHGGAPALPGIPHGTGPPRPVLHRRHPGGPAL